MEGMYSHFDGFKLRPQSDGQGRKPSRRAQVAPRSSRKRVAMFRSLPASCDWPGPQKWRVGGQCRKAVGPADLPAESFSGPGFPPSRTGQCCRVAKVAVPCQTQRYAADFAKKAGPALGNRDLAVRRYLPSFFFKAVREALVTQETMGQRRERVRLCIQRSGHIGRGVGEAQMVPPAVGGAVNIFVSFISVSCEAAPVPTVRRVFS